MEFIHKTHNIFLGIKMLLFGQLKQLEPYKFEAMCVLFSRLSIQHNYCSFSLQNNKKKILIVCKKMIVSLQHVLHFIGYS